MLWKCSYQTGGQKTFHSLPLPVFLLIHPKEQYMRVLHFCRKGFLWTFLKLQNFNVYVMHNVSSLIISERPIVYCLIKIIAIKTHLYTFSFEQNIDNIRSQNKLRWNICNTTKSLKISEINSLAYRSKLINWHWWIGRASIRPEQNLIDFI